MSDPVPVYVVQPAPTKAEALMSLGCAITLVVFVGIPLVLFVLALMIGAFS